METEFEKDVADLYYLWEANFGLDTWIKSSDVMAMIEALPHTSFQTLMDRYPGSKWGKMHSMIDNRILHRDLRVNECLLWKRWDSHLKSWAFCLLPPPSCNS